MDTIFIRKHFTCGRELLLLIQLSFLIFISFFFIRLRQNLREKHARHVADLKAYYESEIQLLKDKLKLEDLPQDVAKANQALTKRYVIFYMH